MNISRLSFLAFALLAAACSSVAPAPPVPSGVVPAWVELGPDGALVRALTPSSACPELTVDGQVRSMRVRAAATAPDYPITACEAALPAAARSASVGGQALALPVASPRRILVIGDTGCRMEAPSDFQACNDPAAWPFARVAARTAAWKPDVIVHLGDYHYRESPCPAGNTGCAGNPSGYNWASWQSDFFGPAAPLLRAAPWIVIRGNHEACNRAGEGWFRFLETRPRPSQCTDDTAAYVLRLGAVSLAVIDSAPASDTKAEPKEVARYQAQLAAIAKTTPPYTWLATHRPVWAGVNIGGPPNQPTLATGNATLQAAMPRGLPGTVGLLLAGHVHLFEALGFGESRPPIMVVGNSGTLLDGDIPQSLVGMSFDGQPATTAKLLHQFGYVTMEPAGADWKATVHAVDGSTLTVCTIARRAITCTP